MSEGFLGDVSLHSAKSIPISIANCPRRRDKVKSVFFFLQKTPKNYVELKIIKIVLDFPQCSNILVKSCSFVFL